MSEKKKVLVGMSGGVDSSVAVMLLKEQGYEVTGVTLHLFEGGCCNLDSAWDAKMICKRLGIEHITLDYMDLFKSKIINNFIDEYKNCRTPNPCIICNKYLKFGVMYEKAKELGIDYIATGHYAKSEYDEKYGRYVLKKADNLAKDQTYYLYYINKDIIDHILFPLGNFKDKEEIREIARKYNFTKVANKKDSEDICFVPDGDYKEFLENNSDIKAKKGNIVDLQGNILGTHDGLYKYTIGQRKGIGISSKTRLFVIDFDKEKNELIVGEEKDLYKKEMIVTDYNLLLMDDIKENEKIEVNIKTRYSAKESKGVLEKIGENTLKVTFDELVPRITPGQSAVFYIDDVVLGGGIIKE